MTDSIHAQADMNRRAGNWSFKHDTFPGRYLSTNLTAWETCIHATPLSESCRMCQKGLTPDAIPRTPDPNDIPE